MAGHSKWANIKHRKSAQDAKRGKVFTKLIRELTVAARLGGGDVTANPRLRSAVDKALASNMTRDTVNRAIDRGTGEGAADDLEEIRYEGYGPQGVAIMVDCLTNNRNRTVAEVRHLFSKHGGNLGTSGSVSYLFNSLAQFIFTDTTSEETLMEIALEADADDVVSLDEGGFEVRAAPEKYGSLEDAFRTAKLATEQAGITMVPSTTISVDDVDAAAKLIKLVDLLEDLDDVQSVYSNADIPEEVLSKL